MKKHLATLKSFLSTLPSFAMAKWNAMLTYFVEEGNRYNLLVGTLESWFLSTIVLYMGMYVSYKHAYPFLGAVLCFLLIALHGVNAVLHWEAFKHFRRYGKESYGHLRRQRAE